MGPNQGFEVRIWKDEQPDHYGATGPVTTTSARFDVSGAYGVQRGGSGRYYWTVAVVQVNPYQHLGPEAPPRTLNFLTGDNNGGPEPTVPPPTPTDLP